MIGALDDFSFEVGEDFRQGVLELQPLIAAVGKQLLQERIPAEQGCKQQDAAVAVLDIGRVDDGVEQQTQRIYEKVALLALDLLARIIAMRIDPRPRFFRALDALAIDDGGSGTGFAFALLAALHIKRVMDAIECAVVAPQVEIIVHRATRRQVFRNRPPLASRAQNIHDPIHHFTNVDVAFVAAAPWPAGSTVQPAPILRR